MSESLHPNRWPQVRRRPMPFGISGLPLDHRDETLKHIGLLSDGRADLSIDDNGGAVGLLLSYRALWPVQGTSSTPDRA